jgi:hypothetical protein
MCALLRRHRKSGSQAPEQGAFFTLSVKKRSLTRRSNYFKIYSQLFTYICLSNIYVQLVTLFCMQHTYVVLETYTCTVWKLYSPSADCHHLFVELSVPPAQRRIFLAEAYHQNPSKK